MNNIVYDYITEYIRDTMPKNNDFLIGLEEYAHLNNVPIIQPEVAKLISVIGQIKRPMKILEVGTAIGYSAIYMSSFLQSGGTITTIERNEKMTEIAKINIKNANLDGIINILEGDAIEILPTINDEFDLIFIDASKGHYQKFFEECIRMLRPEGILISDNILYKGMIANDELVIRRKKTIVNRMRKYLINICENANLETSLIPIGDGVALSYKRS